MDTEHAGKLLLVSLAVSNWQKAREAEQRAAQLFEEVRADYQRATSTAEVRRRELEAAYRDLEEA